MGGDRDRPKKSWREIDQQRDRSGGARPPSREERHSPKHSETASKQYRAQLDALFAKGEVGKLAEKLMSGRPVADAVKDASKPPPPPEPERPAREPLPAAPPPPPKDETRAALRKKLAEALGRDEITRAFEKWVKAYGLPSDFELLEQGLEHNKPERQREVIDALEQLLSRDKPKRSRTLVGKLRFIQETSSDEELRQAAARVRGKL